MLDWIQVDPRDNVATLLQDAPMGQGVGDGRLVATQDVPRGHKIALAPIPAGEAVIKFGFPIGCATTDIAPGQHVHSHNLATALTGDHAYCRDPAPLPSP
ncbi:UxaA family hydrolase, partial [uncultured Sphingomonas sp.]|uniref:UxaA family hydrolase n=1 Tax=uncultured Sphingomonas sp. TaxID=158754 RepID=UPI00260B137D